MNGPRQEALDITMLGMRHAQELLARLLDRKAPMNGRRQEALDITMLGMRHSQELLALMEASQRTEQEFMMLMGFYMNSIQGALQADLEAQEAHLRALIAQNTEPVA